MYLDMPFILGILILLFISIVLARIWSRIANAIGEEVRMFFMKLWKAIKG